MIELLNGVARAWWSWMAEMFWQVGLLIVLIACLDRLIRRWAWPQLRYALWSLVLIKLILPPTMSLPSGVVPELRPVVASVVGRLEIPKARRGQNAAAIPNLKSQIQVPAPYPDFGLRIPDSTRHLGTAAEGVFSPTSGQRVAVAGLIQVDLQGFGFLDERLDAARVERQRLQRPAQLRIDDETGD